MKRIVQIVGAIIFLFVAYRLLRPTGVESAEVVRGPAVRAVYATGTVEPTVMIPIAPRLMGRLIELNLDEGAVVSTGQQLARLEDQDLKSTWDELKARKDIAARELDRARTLIDKGAISKSEIDKIRSDFDAATAALRRADVEAGYMILRAPQSGRIIRRDGELGQLIPANQAVFWMSGTEPLRITAEVDEEDIALLKVGNKVLVRADAFGNQSFDGVVNSITEKGDPVARSFRVRIGLPADSPLRIGMTAETNIILEEKQDAILVPSSALTKQGTVWKIVDGRIDEQVVQTGIKGVEKTEIVSGLSPGDEVVVAPAATLKKGMRVRSLGSK